MMSEFSEIEKAIRQDAVLTHLMSGVGLSLRRKQEDINEIVKRLIALPGWPYRSCREFARFVGCDHKQISKALDAIGVGQPNVKIVTRNGKQYSQKKRINDNVKVAPVVSNGYVSSASLEAEMNFDSTDASFVVVTMESLTNAKIKGGFRSEQEAKQYVIDDSNKELKRLNVNPNSGHQGREYLICQVKQTHNIVPSVKIEWVLDSGKKM